MASGNESQGLKIAVAIFVSLTVILAVATYFMYSEYSKTSELLASAKTEAQQKTQAAAAALNDFRNLRDRAGYSDKNDVAAITKEISDDQDALLSKLSAANEEMNQALAKAAQAGIANNDLETYRGNLTQTMQRFQDESTQAPTFKASLDTLADLTANQAKLATALALDNANLRAQLANVDAVNDAELEVQTKAAQKSSTDLADQVNKYERIRQDQMVQIDQLQTERARLIAERDSLNTRIAQMEATYGSEMDDLRNQLGFWRTEAEKNETILDTADGTITYVNNSQGEVLTNLTRSMGAKPQMLLAVFDRDAQGLPSDKPKARIKLIQVSENQSIGKIEEQFDLRNPLREGDQLYSAAWSPGQPQRFALIGKIDMNQDGRDDRDDLITLIEAAGGMVEYDLPPPGFGREEGELTARSSWYVIDEREPIRTPGNQRAVEQMSEAEEAFNKRRTEAIQKARDLGVRPIPIERLLSSLGYSYGMTIPGRIEARNNQAIRDILNPRGLSLPPQNNGNPDQN